MKLNVTQRDVWAATIEDQPGGLHEKLAALSKAGANLEFVVSRRAPEKPGKGVVFVTPLKGAKQTKAAETAGFQKLAGLHSVRIEATDKPGVGAAIAKALADTGINLRGLSGAALGRRFVLYLALDTSKDAARAAAILKQLS
jgi:hypothetical protein